LIPIDEFDSDKSWIIENWWTEEEKVEIGLKKAKTFVSPTEFQDLLSDMISTLKDFKEEIEWLN